MSISSGFSFDAKQEGLSIAEYIWLDGSAPVQKLRSKSRLLPYQAEPQVQDFPNWGFDGSSTYQATGDKSDLELRPAAIVADPFRGPGNYLVMCEVFTAQGESHPTNYRKNLRLAMDQVGASAEPFIGFEQEYTLFKDGSPLGFPNGGYPAPQGPYYCSIGASTVFGRPIVEKHLNLCLAAGLAVYGINAEVMPGQWEFQIGYRGLKEDADPLTMADHVWFARYLLERVAEESGVTVKWDCKPMLGDWNGAGMHTNFSTRATREKGRGAAAIEQAVTALSKRHAEHIREYGAGLELRLTGHHETCSIHEFKSGAGNRGASIRIPLSTAQNGYGYIEDRRPGANADPYRVAFMLLETICGAQVR
jgi:glutamine synthetase